MTDEEKVEIILKQLTHEDIHSEPTYNLYSPYTHYYLYVTPSLALGSKLLSQEERQRINAWVIERYSKYLPKEEN